MRRTAALAALSLTWVALAATACSFGLYDDSGRADPGQWYPWVCPDGGDALAPDSGCEPRPCADAAVEGGKDGKDGGC
jgi:hypothetical protein